MQFNSLLLLDRRLLLFFCPVFPPTQAHAINTCLAPMPAFIQHLVSRVGQSISLFASENKASKKLSCLLSLGAESAFLVTQHVWLSSTPSNSIEGAGGSDGSRRVRGKMGIGSQPVGNTKLLGWSSFLPNCSPALLGLCYPKHIIKYMQLLCQSLARILLLCTLGQLSLQILVDSRTSLLLSPCWHLGQVMEQCCNVLPLQEILLTKGAI